MLLDRGEKVRVIGRDAARLQPLVNKGAVAAVGDLRSTAFLSDALRGTRGVFAMIPPNYDAPNFRAYQEVVGTSIVSAIRDAGVTHVVNLSSQGAELPRGTGPILGLHDQEKRLNAQGINVLHLRPTYFMENLLANIPLIHDHGFAGSAVRGDLKFAMIATADIAERVVEHLLAVDFSGNSHLDLLGQRDLSLQEAFTVIGRKIGIPNLPYRQMPYDEFTQALLDMGMSRDVCRLFVEMSDALNRSLFAVNRPRTAENTTPTSIEMFADLFAEIYRGAGLRHAA
jgi:uncharacterized protein YbjT (DUF2867 family)